MAETLIITLLSPDRAGIVAKIAHCVREHQGNWLESRMGHLGGQFAGILQVDVEEEQVESLKKALSELDPKFRIQVEKNPAATVGGENALIVQVSIVGQDRPGIVESLFTVFSEAGINVEDLRTHRRGAPHSGQPLFQAVARLRVPGTVVLTELRSHLEDIADDLAVDLDWIQ